MKRVKLLLIVGLLYPAIVFPQFKIEGNLGKANQGKVYLLAGKDTLGSQDLQEGKFVLKGKLKTPIVAFLMLNGQNYKTPLFLENADLKVQPGVESRTLKVSGRGKLQQQQQEYLAAFQENDQKIQETEAQLREAKTKQNLFEVMMARANFLILDSIRNDIENQFIARYPNSLVSLYHFYKGLHALDYNQLQAKYSLLGEEMKNTDWGKMITARYENWERVAVGSIAPDFTLDMPNGEPVALYSVKAKVKILDFWASWCGPCRAESPVLVELYRKYKSQGLEIVSVSLDAKIAPWKKAIEADGLAWIHVSSLKGWNCPVASLYRINSVPSIFILDENNRIIATKVRGEKLEEIVAEKLK